VGAAKGGYHADGGGVVGKGVRGGGGWVKVGRGREVPFSKGSGGGASSHESNGVWQSRWDEEVDILRTSKWTGPDFATLRSFKNYKPFALEEFRLFGFKLKGKRRGGGERVATQDGGKHRNAWFVKNQDCRCL